MQSRFTICALALGSLALPHAGQPQTERPLRAAATVLPRDFSQLRGLRELEDGRVLISDRIEERVFLADFGPGTLTPIGRSGRGPTEYRLPTNLLWMPGDSTLLVDEGNQRLAVIGPDMKIHRSFWIEIPGVPGPMGVSAVDRTGRYYLQSPFWVPRPEQMGDSVYLLRTRASTKSIDTIGTVLGITQPPDVTKPRLVPGFPFVAMAPQDAWNVRRDGTVVIVRSNPYRLEWSTADRQHGRGPEVPYSKIRVTDAEKTAFTRQFVVNSPISGRGDGGMSATPASALEAEQIRQMVAHNAYAEYKGPITGSKPFVSEDGTVWVEATVPFGAAQLVDVFDTSGRRVDRLRLPPHRRLLGVGRKALYLVTTDDDGLERLERYAWPQR